MDKLRHKYMYSYAKRGAKDVESVSVKFPLPGYPLFPIKRPLNSKNRRESKWKQRPGNIRNESKQSAVKNKDERAREVGVQDSRVWDTFPHSFQVLIYSRRPPFFFCSTFRRSARLMRGRTPPKAMVARIRVSSSSSPRMASCRWRGVIRLTLRSLAALPASSRTSAVRYSRTAVT